MQLPTKTTSAQRCVGYGRFVARGLHKTGETALCVRARAACDGLRSAVYAREDAEVSLQDAHCDRFFCRLVLDDTARLLRMRLSSRSLDAVKQLPYTAIFPEGVAPYVNARLRKLNSVYQLLLLRITDHLPEDDPLRVEFVPLFTEQLAAWKSAHEEVDREEVAMQQAWHHQYRLRAQWEAEMRAIYGDLFGRFGRKHAERFFPKTIRAPEKPTP